MSRESYYARFYRKFRESANGKWWLYTYFIISFEERRKARAASNQKPKKIDVQGRIYKGVWDITNK